MNVDLARSACIDALRNEGFEPVNSGICIRRTTADFLGWVGLHEVVGSVGVALTPYVGVHCIPMMQLYCTFVGKDYAEGAIATYAVPISDLAPHVSVVEFGEDGTPGAHLVRRLVVEHGLPLMKHLSILENLLPRLLTRVEQLGGYPQRYAIGLHLSGRSAEAQEFVRAKRVELENDAPAVRENFELFAESFLAYLDPT
jgi:hypothetical protein